MKTTVATIDFGTSKIVTLVAENSGSQRCDIVAAGIAKYDGYLDEGWNNPQELDTAIRQSLADAEEQSGTKIRAINVGVPGAFTRVYATKVTVALKGTDPRVSSQDVKAAFKKAAENLDEIPGVVIHSSPACVLTARTLSPCCMSPPSIPQGSPSTMSAEELSLSGQILHREGLKMFFRAILRSLGTKRVSPLSLISATGASI